jgi:hypothetical protein
MTTIAEVTVRFLMICTIGVIYNTTICGVHNLGIVQCCCFLDLLFDNRECVHEFTPKEMGFNLLPFRVIRFPFLQSFASYDLMHSEGIEILSKNLFFSFWDNCVDSSTTLTTSFN